MENKPNNPKLWAIVKIVVAVIGCISLLGSAVITALPDLLKTTPEVEQLVTDTGTQNEDTTQPTSEIVTPTDNEIDDISSQQDQCDWLQDNLPQTADDVIREFGLPSDTTIKFIYELCPSAANAFAFKANSAVELEVPDGGCIDSWSGFTEYIGDVGTPVEDGHGGWRVYRGIVRAPEMTYRIAGCK